MFFNFFTSFFKMVILKDNNGILEIPNDPKFEPNPNGYAVYCFEKMKEHEHKIAQIDVDTNKYETYGEILKRSVRVALHMKSLGVRHADIISLCTDTHLDTCLPFWAAAFSGIKIANLDPTLPSSDMEYLTNLVKPKLIFCIPASVKNLEIIIKKLNLDTKLVIFGDTEKHIPFKEFLKPQENEQDFKPKKTENMFDFITILFSSGTTGFSKGVCVTHYGILSMMNIFRHMFFMRNVLFYSSPYWITYIVILSSTLISGGSRILCKSFDASRVLKIIQDFKVTYLFMPPTNVFGVTSQSEITSETYDTSSLHSMMIAGGSLVPEQIERMRKLVPHTIVNHVYGLTEISCAFSGFYSDTNTSPDVIRSKIASCGRMIPGAMCKVVDIVTNKTVGKNHRGELRIKTKRIMSGYYNDPKKTEETFDEEDFFCTGDVVYYDDDYYFYVVDRIKEMFKYKTWHIVPAELENILLKHPSVKEVLVIGYPHEEDGDHPMAIIVPKENVNIRENEILQYFNDTVSDRKKLRGGVKFVKSLPKTTTGKYSRIKLRNMVINNEI